MGGLSDEPEAMKEKTQDLPGLFALTAIDSIMKANQEKRGDSWVNSSINFHVHAAMVHLHQVGIFPPEAGCEDHLAHALTRMAMALVLRQNSPARTNSSCQCALKRKETQDGNPQN